MLVKKNIIFCAVLVFIIFGSNNIFAKSQSLDKVIILNLEFKNNVLALNGADLAYNFPPNKIVVKEKERSLFIKKLSSDRSVLEEYFIYDPRIVFVDQSDEKGKLIANGGGNIFKKDAVFDLILSYTKDTKIIEIYDQNKMRLISIDLTNHIKHFCGVKDDICDQNCTDLIEDPDCKEEIEKINAEHAGLNIEKIVIAITIVTGVVILTYVLYKKRKNKKKKLDNNEFWGK